MPKDDDCFVPCDTDALLSEGVVDSKPEGDKPARINVKKILKRRIEISAPV